MGQYDLVEVVGKFPAEFGRTEHECLADVPRGIKGKYLPAINEYPDVRDLYAGAGVRASDYATFIIGEL